MLRKTKLKISIISLILLCAMAVNLTGCVMPVRAQSLMDGVVPNQIIVSDDMDAGNAAVTDFALRLFKATSKDGQSTLISPLSVIYALAMTANGASGETLKQMENVLGVSLDELNLYLYSYMYSLPQSDKYKLNLANSIWFKEDDAFKVVDAFLQKNADYYGADIYSSKFNEQTLRDINNWVKNETEGMIPKVLDSIPDDAIMYLINALAFEAEWLEVYEKYQVNDEIFTREDGTEESVELMYCTENEFLEDENATGFIKYYSGRKYAFAALLPKEGISVSDYLDSLDGESLHAMLSGSKNAIVHTAIPKFELEYSASLSESLSAMGMSDAFSAELANFSGIGSYGNESLDGNIYIGDVIHKTYIQVGEKGTKAGAVTVVHLAGAADPGEMEIKEVYLDRPFVYMLIDCENNVPFFIGTMMSVD